MNARSTTEDAIIIVRTQWDHLSAPVARVTLFNLMRKLVTVRKFTLCVSKFLNIYCDLLSFKTLFLTFPAIIPSPPDKRYPKLNLYCTKVTLSKSLLCFLYAKHLYWYLFNNFCEGKC